MLSYTTLSHHKRLVRLGGALLAGLTGLAVALLALQPALAAGQPWSARQVNESDRPAGQDISTTHVIPPPQGGRPKLDQSVKTVTPTLTLPGNLTLVYTIRIKNTGSYTAFQTSLTDPLPAGVTYNGDAQASAPPAPTYEAASRTIRWQGDVGFNKTVVITFGVSIPSTFSGALVNSATISQSLIASIVTATAQTIVTDRPILVIGKKSAPTKPGPNGMITYTLVITNRGQPAANLPITATDRVPANTTLSSIGPNGVTSPISDVVTWTRNVDLAFNQATEFTFSAKISNVTAGTILTNANYQVSYEPAKIAIGDPSTVTVVNPKFSLSKEVWPDPPGSNRPATYTLVLVNQGSLATNLVVTDRVPAGVIYLNGGSYNGGVVSWSLPQLDTGGVARFTYTASITDVAELPITNSNYRVCSAEGICQAGEPLTSTIHGATFEAFATLNPNVKKPGGGGGPVTPTLVIRNIGPGSALNATAILYFYRISVSANDLHAIPPVGAPSPFPPGPDCADQCVSYVWTGDMSYGQVVTFTTIDAQSTIGGEEGLNYTATVVITDTLTNFTTPPVTGTAVGTITHLANLIPFKSAPAVIGPGQLLTYTITAWNSGFTMDSPAILTDVVPLSNTTLIAMSDGGVSQIINGATVASWTLPVMSTGEQATRTFTVRVNNGLISGTQIVNSNYSASGYGNIPLTGIKSGAPVTTTVQEVGLIASYKEVSPTITRPGDDVRLTFYLHIVNSGDLPLTGVTVEDLLPWEVSTYQGDAVPSSGTITEQDNVSVHWAGNIAPLSSAVVTLSVKVDPNYQGAVTNTMIINHSTLPAKIVRPVVAYVTNKPVLRLSKVANVDPIDPTQLLYALTLQNQGQQATNLVITDTIPAGTSYVPNSASAGGQLVGDQVRWQLSALEPNESKTFEFKVTFSSGSIINAYYAATAAEGVRVIGEPITTTIRPDDSGGIYLPIIMKTG